MRHLIRRIRGDGSDARQRQDRAPGRWWWTRIICGALLLIWRTILLALTWHTR